MRPLVSPPFQIQTVLCNVVKPLLFAYIDSTFPFNRRFALWFPIVGNKGVGTTMVVVFLPEVTQCLVDLGKFVSFVRELVFCFNPLGEDEGKSVHTPNGWSFLTGS